MMKTDLQYFKRGEVGGGEAGEPEYAILTAEISRLPLV